MAFIGESRRSSAAPWDSYLCLRKDEARIILPTLERELRKAEKELEFYEGLNEAGEMTARQQTSLDRWEDRVGVLNSIVSHIKSFLKK